MLFAGHSATVTLAKDEAPAKIDPAVLRSRVKELPKLQADWTRLMEKRGIPGMAITVVHKDEVIFSSTLGQRDPVNGLPVTGDTMFYIASCTKTYVAMAVLTLVESGKVELDAPVKKYLPRFEIPDKQATRTLTIRDLLTHAKGLSAGPAVILDAYTGEITEDRYYHWLKKAELAGEFEYTNTHYTLLGRVIEAVTGTSWKDYLRERLFEPAGMYRTTAYASKMYGSDDAAIPCEHNGTRVEPAPVRKTDRVMHAAGGLGTSLNDLTRWLRLNLNYGVIDGRRIVSADSIEAMQKLQCQHGLPSKMPGSTRDGYGFGWFVGTYHGHPMVEHGGGYVGTAATISLMPQHDLGVAVVANGSSSLIHIAAFEIYAVLLGLEPGNSLEQLEAAIEPHFKRLRAWHEYVADNPVDADGLSLPLARYVGKYFNPHWGTIAVREKDGALTLQFGDMPVRVLSTGKDEIAMSWRPGSKEAVRFERFDDKRVTALIFKDPDDSDVRFERTSDGPS